MLVGKRSTAGSCSSTQQGKDRSISSPCSTATCRQVPDREWCSQPSFSQVVTEGGGCPVRVEPLFVSLASWKDWGEGEEDDS